MTTSDNARAELRQSLSGQAGEAWWKRLHEWGESEAFERMVREEMPTEAARLSSAVERRDFLRLMGASLAAAGLGACTRQPDEKIVPFARTPEATVPGRPQYFATALPLGGAALGLLVESHMGRPTKVEGNPDHPGSLGATDAFAQAAVLGLYDPDRSQSILQASQISTWDAFRSDLDARLDRLEALQGEGLRLLVGEEDSPSLGASLERVRERFPKARIHRWHPVHRDHARLGALRAFGTDVVSRYRLGPAEVIVSLDADFLAAGIGGVRYAREFAPGRRVRHDTETMGRHYALECAPTLTGAAADHRLALRPSEVEGLARALASELGVDVQAPALTAERQALVGRMAADLARHRGKSLVVAGDWQSPEVHALAHAINDELDNVGRTVEYIRPAAPSESGVAESIEALVKDIRAGDVALLVMLGGNPVYDAPADLDFAAALQDVPFRVHLALQEDETSELCHWHVPQAHVFESWGDARAYDGTVSIVQPLIAPLYAGKTALELVDIVAGNPAANAYEAVRAFWKAQQPAGASDADFEAFWHAALHDGVVAGTAFPALELRLDPRLDFGPPATAHDGLELAIRPDASVFDGRFANNGWLQELPRPLTRITWDNALLMSPATAAARGLSTGDVLELTADGRRITGPLWLTPGHSDDVVTVHLGYGRRNAGRIGTGVGFDAYPLRTTRAPWSRSGVDARRVGSGHAFACVQDHARMEGRDIVRVAEFDRFKKDPHGTWPRPAHDPAELSLYPEHPYDGYAWGMVIDLNACIGCNACMIACQSENNIPIVGKQEVARGRELHWIRIDRYYEQADEGVKVLHQPVPCMHCEQAPCEVVCPVGATVHSAEGLNEMVYNRCVGTRYCANNCPYKVRHFNFFHYADYETESLKLGNNPDVTVRSRGVMEKCTYCVQRINQGRIAAKKDGRAIAEGEVRTACQQVCPTQAIAFGDLNDESSEVARLRREPQHYALLEEVGTRPRTTYLAKLENPGGRDVR